MKKHFFNYLLILSIFMQFSCQNGDPKAGNFMLLPSPQKFDVQGTSDLNHSDLRNIYLDKGVQLPVIGELTAMQITDNLSDAQVILKFDDKIEREGYALQLNDDGVNIVASDQAGFLYGLMTLQQLMEDAQDQAVNLPLCNIQDNPLLAYRAIHLDVKHHMERKAYYYQLMDRLVKYKINGVIVELEDKIKYESQPLIGSPDAWTIEEWKELSDYAMKRNIEISPLVQGLGHASFILKHEEYKHLRDDPESDWAFNPLDPETYEVQFDLYREAIAATPHGKYLHIGGDEVHTTGQNSGKTPLELQLIWLNKVCQYAAAQGRVPIFWDDMPLKFAEVYRPMFRPEMQKEEVDSIWVANEPRLLKFIDQFPKNCIYMRWNYSTPDAYGNFKAMDWFTKNGFQVMGATAGQTRWVLMPQNESNIGNIKSFALSSIENGLNGLLLTLWDDDSPHFELYMRGILAFAEYSWAGDQRDASSVKAAFRQRYFGPNVTEDMAFIDLLEKPVGLWKNSLVKSGVSRNDLIKRKGEGVIDLPDPNDKGAWTKKYAERLEAARNMLSMSDSIANKIEMVKANADRNTFTLQVYEQVNEMVRFTAQTLLTLEAYDKPSELVNENEAREALTALNDQFVKVRSNMEAVYGQTRILTKPDNYILDQDHHRHSANQTTSFDWQYIAELALLKKLEEEIK